MALQVHWAKLPVKRGQNVGDSGSGQSLCLRETSGQLWAPLSSLPPHFSPRELGRQNRESNLPGGSRMRRAPLQEARRIFFVSFPIPGKGKAVGASAVPRYQLTHFVPALGHHPTQGTWAQACSLERLCFPKGMEGAGAEVMTQGPKGWDLSPLLYTPGPGQHVDVSAELSGILSQLLWCGIVPRVHWLQWGPTGTHWWLQQESHARGQEQQGEAAAHGGHLRNKQGDGGKTELTHAAP